MIVQQRDTGDSTVSGAGEPRGLVEVLSGRLARSAGKRIMKEPRHEILHLQLMPSLAIKDWTRLVLLEGLLNQPKYPFEECAMQRKMASHLPRVPGPGNELENASCM